MEFYMFLQSPNHDIYISYVYYIGTWYDFYSIITGWFKLKIKSYIDVIKG